MAAFIMFVVLVLQAWIIYRHPDLKPHPVISQESAYGHGFRWFHMEQVSGIIPPIRTSEGAIWGGFSLGVSRENGKIAIISIQVYGAEQGVGHYTWRARTDRFSSEVGAGGHFNIDHLIGEEESRRKSRILGYAVDEASRGVGGYYRPLQFTVDEQGNMSSIYDPKSGRAVFPVFDEENMAVFGPHPAVDPLVPYMHQPGVYIREILPTQEELKQLRFKVWDVYVQHLDYVSISVDSDTGYRYEQNLNAEQTNAVGLTIAVPSMLTNIQVTIARGGYHSITENIELYEGIQRVDAFMEPLCVLLGDTIVCPEESEH